MLKIGVKLGSNKKIGAKNLVFMGNFERTNFRFPSGPLKKVSGKLHWHLFCFENSQSCDMIGMNFSYTRNFRQRKEI